MRHKKKPTPYESLVNLYTGLGKALESFEEVFKLDDGVLWDSLPYAGKVWPVRMKFALAYVIGDTELHDKLC